MTWSFHSPIVGNICDAPSPLVTPPGEIGLLQPDKAWLRMAHYWWLISSTDFLRPEFLSHQSISPSVTWSHLVARNLLTTIAKKNCSSAACMKSSQLESWNRRWSQNVPDSNWISTSSSMFQGCIEMKKLCERLHAAIDRFFDAWHVWNKLAAAASKCVHRGFPMDLKLRM